MLSLVVIFGLSVAYLGGRFAMRDWAALGAAWQRYETVVAGGGDQHALLVAITQQAVYRTNCFAEGVGALLGVLIASVGVHGLCLLCEREPAPAPPTR